MLFAKVLLLTLDVDLVCCCKHEAAVKLLFEREGNYAACLKASYPIVLLILAFGQSIGCP